MTPMRRPTLVTRRPSAESMTTSTPPVIVSTQLPISSPPTNSLSLAPVQRKRTAPVAAATSAINRVTSLAPELRDRAVQAATDNAAQVFGVIAGAAIALQAVLITLGLTALVAVVAVLGTRGAGTNTGWAEPISVATQLWILGHGGIAKIGGLPMDIIPLGLTLVYLLLFISCARRAMHKSHHVTNGTGNTAIGVYSFLAMFVSNVAGQTTALNLRIGLGALLISTLGITLVFRRAIFGYLTKMRFWQHWITESVRIGLYAAAAALLATVGVGAVLVAAWAALGRAATTTAVSELAPGIVGGVILGIGQLAFLPNWISWAAAWLAGPGFAIGQQTVFAPGSYQGGPLPALPLFATLPPANWSGPLAPWTPTMFVVIGGLAGWLLWQRLSGRLANLLVGLAATTVVLACSMALLQSAASGGLGLGRMVQIGANPLLVAGLFGAETLVGCLVVISSQYASSKLTTRQAFANA